MKFLVYATIIGLAACTTGVSHEISSEETNAPSVDAMLADFRSILPDTAHALAEVASSQDELLRIFGRVVETGDTTVLQTLVMSPTEFAYLYYPEDIQSKAPYELPPGLMWTQMENANNRGMRRLLQEYQGKTIDVSKIACDTAVAHGASTIWSRCLVDGVKMFGGIIERDGRYKLISLANKL